MLLHYGLLAEAAGGVDGIIIGSELRGLTSIRDQDDAFPFVEHLKALAEDIKAITGSGTKLTYGADWSEYFGYHPQDGSGDVYFNLDPLWASDAIDAVGIDNYMPLTDFRDDDFTHPQPDGADLAEDMAAMRRAITSGEGFDWYYVSNGARRGRLRSAIEDGLAGKHWLYRFKDIEGWWSHHHHERRDGAELPGHSDWMPGMKPVWFTELGCPAVERGANQPNVFIDSKSSESATPYFSTGMRSDETQRRYLDAHHAWWNSDAAPEGMVDPGFMFAWTWDARPMPSFPEYVALFADGDNWPTGHWLSGRLGAGTLSTVIAAILTDHGTVDFDVSAVSGDLKGYVAGTQASARDLLEPLVLAHRLDVTDRDGVLRFRSRGVASLPATEVDVFADRDNETRWSEVIAQGSDFASEAIIDFQGELNEYEMRSARSRRVTPANDRVLRVALPGVLPDESAQFAAEGLLRDHRLSRRQISFSLSPNAIEYEPGDVVTLEDGPSGRFLITRIEDGQRRDIEAREIGGGDSAGLHTRIRRRRTGRDGNAGFAPVIYLMDLPHYGERQGSGTAVAAATARPWRRIALSVSATTEDYEKRMVMSRPARSGLLMSAISGGCAGRMDHATVLDVTMQYGGLSSVSLLSLLNGANRLAMRAANGAWEITGFQSAVEIAPGRWHLRGLLRGLGGTEDALSAGAPAGAAVVVLDAAVTNLNLASYEAGLDLNWIAEPFGSGGGRVGPSVFAGGMRAETPLAPVHLRADRGDGDDILLRWVRRSRLNADSWNGDDIPLDEASERYQIQILDGSEPVRTEAASSNAFLYSGAMQIADFGTTVPEVTFEIRQKGSRVALGLAARKTIIL